MGISILELVLQKLRQADFPADVAYPGQKFPQISQAVAAVHIAKVDRAGQEVTVEVNIVSPAEQGGTACELAALRATEALREAGAVCIQSGCKYDGVTQVYVVPVLAAFMAAMDEDRYTVGPGFTVSIDGQVQACALAFSAEELTGCQAEPVMGEAAPGGTSRGSCLWQIRLEELIPMGTAEEPEPAGSFVLQVATAMKTETYGHCDWTSIQREFTREGLRRSAGAGA